MTSADGWTALSCLTISFPASSWAFTLCVKRRRMMVQCPSDDMTQQPCPSVRDQILSSEASSVRPRSRPSAENLVAGGSQRTDGQTSDTPRIIRARWDEFVEISADRITNLSLIKPPSLLEAASPRVGLILKIFTLDSVLLPICPFFVSVGWNYVRKSCNFLYTRLTF